MEDKNLMQITNKVVLLINSLLSSFLVIGYTLEYFKGQRSLQYIAVFICSVLIPIAGAIVLYIKDSRSIYIKYVTMAGYMIVYTIAVTTSLSQLSFVYIFPILVMYLLYFNLRLMVYSCSYMFFINVAVILYKLVSGQTSARVTTDLTIQFAAITLFGIALILSTRLSNQLNSSKISSINQQKEKQEEILASILKAAGILDANTKDLSAFTNEFNISMNQVTSAVEEISKGAQETSENITQQSMNTEKISQLIQKTSALSKQMELLSTNSINDVTIGLQIVNQLDEKAALVDEQSLKVEVSMGQLKEKTAEIQGITSIIAGISGQTNLLSLNASIEAARAGEAGKGFAVVADEIRQLADQSKQSSTKISAIISDLQNTVNECVNQIQNMKNVNNEQNEYIVSTKDVFGNISTNTGKLSGNIQEVNSKITTIVQSNEQVIESINKIAAVSQQTAASSQEANAMATSNLKNAEELMKKINEIIETSNQMKKYAE